MQSKSIILIGMPGAGKSTVGPLLAERLGLAFQDTDRIVREKDGRELRNIVAEDGFERFLEIQFDVIQAQDLTGCVIATGGGVVKTDLLMLHFKKLGTVIHLKWDFEILEHRLEPGRRLAKAGGQSFRQMFEERAPLYQQYADYTVECTGKSPVQITEEIIMKIL